jgi:hypothetical protein
MSCRCPAARIGLNLQRRIDMSWYTLGGAPPPAKTRPSRVAAMMRVLGKAERGSTESDGRIV